MENTLTNNLLEKLGIDADEVKNGSAREMVTRRRAEYLAADEGTRIAIHSEQNVEYVQLVHKTYALIEMVPTLAKLAYDAEKQSEHINVAAKNFFGSFFVDFDRSAVNSVAQLVNNTLRRVKKDEISSYREGAHKHILNSIMQKIEMQGEKGWTKSKSKFIRSLKNNYDKMKQFEDVMESFVRFRWSLEMMNDNNFSNGIVDSVSESREGDTRLIEKETII